MSLPTNNTGKGTIHQIMIHYTKEGSRNVDRISVRKVPNTDDESLRNPESQHGHLSSSKTTHQLKIEKKKQHKMGKKNVQSIEPKLASTDVLQSGINADCNISSKSGTNKKAKTVHDLSLKVKSKEPSCSTTAQDPPKSALGFPGEIKEENVAVVPSCSTTVPDTTKSTLGFDGEITHQSDGCLNENSIQNTEAKDKKLGKTKDKVKAIEKRFPREEDGKVGVAENVCAEKAKQTNAEKSKFKAKSFALVKIESENVEKAKKTKLPPIFQGSEEKVKVLKTEKLKLMNETNVRRSERLSLLSRMSYRQ